MSETPRTESEVSRPRELMDDILTVDANFACQLERELNAANGRIKRLEEAGDALAKTQTYDLVETVNWRKAKEAKP